LDRIRHVNIVTRNESDGNRMGNLPQNALPPTAFNFTVRIEQSAASKSA